ncbi:hypothetical protein ACTXT7_009145 [Hymenolepis weldensis]
MKVYRGQIDRIGGISQVTHVVRSIRRWQAGHPNLSIREGLLGYLDSLLISIGRRHRTRWRRDGTILGEL